MKKLFWYFMLSASGVLFGISVYRFFSEAAGELTIYLLISALILSAISAWGAKRYAGIGFFTNRKPNSSLPKNS